MCSFRTFVLSSSTTVLSIVYLYVRLMNTEQTLISTKLTLCFKTYNLSVYHPEKENAAEL